MLGQSFVLSILYLPYKQACTFAHHAKNSLTNKFVCVFGQKYSIASLSSADLEAFNCLTAATSHGASRGADTGPKCRASAEGNGID